MTVENRRFPRTATSTPAHVRWTGPNRWPVECEGTIRDYSRNGLRIELALPVAPQSWLTVTANGRVFRGVVRYCAETGNMFAVGVELTRPY